MGYLQSCPVCQNEQDYNTKAEADRDWRRWKRRLKYHLAQSAERIFSER